MVTWPIARAVLLAAFLCAAAGYFIIARNERKRAGPRLADMDPDHPDREVILTLAQEQALAAMEGQFGTERRQP